MSERREWEEEAIARTEALLHQAAEFDPEERIPERLAERALARWESAGRDCSPRMKRTFTPTLRMTLAGAALLCLLSFPGSDDLLVPMRPTDGESAPKLSIPTDITSSAYELQHTAAPLAMDTRTQVPTMAASHASRHTTGRHRGRLRTPARAIWTVETVRTEQVGVLYTVWTPDEDTPLSSEGDEPIVLHPALLSVPLQSQVSTCEAPASSPFPLPPPLPDVETPREAAPQDDQIDTPDTHEETTQP
ncbi:MAG TPA: hypothetical protein VKU00_09595 [Chthonomonadaceae bacterium]|nr:hypothetical protein [Chthonomonadaceae bacterium]